MRYKEAYGIVNRALEKYNVNFGERLLNSFFDATVNFFGVTVVKELKTEEITADGSSEYVLTNADFSDKVRRVDVNGGGRIPYTPAESIQNEAEDSDFTDPNINLQNGYYLKKGQTEGVITAATSASPIQIEDVGHGLVTGDHVIISEIIGLLSATGALSEVNDLRHTITRIDDDNYTIPVDGSGYAVAYSSGGVWKNDNDIIFFSKAPASGTINIQYYRKPIARSSLTSVIDLHETLVHAVIYRVIAEVLDLEGPIPREFGDKVIYIKPGDHYNKKYLEKQGEYFIERNANLPFPDMIPPALSNMI